jgi:two-component system phosphate regulon response regulator PhoB
VLLDWMLPLHRRASRSAARSAPPDPTANVPIIMLTARSEEGDQRAAASTPAPTTTSPSPSRRRELLARIRAVLRRSRRRAGRRGSSPSPTSSMDLATHRVTRSGRRSISARPSSACCAIFMRASRPRLLPASSCSTRVWGKRRLCRGCAPSTCISAACAIALNGDDHADLIRTVRAAGYALDAQG